MVKEDLERLYEKFLKKSKEDVYFRRMVPVIEKVPETESQITQGTWLMEGFSIIGDLERIDFSKESKEGMCVYYLIYRGLINLFKVSCTFSETTLAYISNSYKGVLLNFINQFNNRDFYKKQFEKLEGSELVAVMAYLNQKAEV